MPSDPQSETPVTVLADPALSPDAVRALFTRSDGRYLFARWGPAIVPLVIGADAATRAAMLAAVTGIATLAGHPMAGPQNDPTPNLPVFFCQAWAELAVTPNLARLVPDIGALCERLERAGANQYRIFRRDEGGAIIAVLILVRIDAHIAAVPPEVLATSQAVQAMLLWSDAAFRDQAPLADIGGRVILRPGIGVLLRASYDSALPDAAVDPAHALRLFARLPRSQ